MTTELPLRLNATFEEESKEGRGGAKDFFDRTAKRMLAEREAFMAGMRDDFSLSDDDVSGIDRQTREITADLLRVAGNRAQDMRKQFHRDGLAAHRDALSAGVRDGRIDGEMAQRRFQVAADNARFFMDGEAADGLMLDGERAIVRAGLDRLVEQVPELVMERVGNGDIGDLVDLGILRPEDVTELQDRAEGEMARQAAQAAAAAGAEGALGVAVDVGLPAVRESERKISAEMRAALEAGDAAAYDRAAGKALALVRFNGALTGEDPAVTEQKVQALSGRFAQLKEQRSEGVVEASESREDPPSRSRLPAGVAKKISRDFVRANIGESREAFVGRALAIGLKPDMAGVIFDLVRIDRGTLAAFENRVKELRKAGRLSVATTFLLITRARDFVQTDDRQVRLSLLGDEIAAMAPGEEEGDQNTERFIWSAIESFWIGGRGSGLGGRGQRLGAQASGPRRAGQSPGAPFNQNAIRPFAKTAGEGNPAVRLQRIKDRPRTEHPKHFFDANAEAVFLTSPFPPITAGDNIRRGMAAVDVTVKRALMGRKDGFLRAMHRKDVGDIALFWGKPGNPATGFTGGKGLSHIIAKRGPEVVERILVAIAKGRGQIKIAKRSTRLIIEHEGTRTVLELHKDGERLTWLLTGYRLGKPSLTDSPFDLNMIKGGLFFKAD
ncbi:MAG: hypothetical protein ABFS30_07070 [Pseudomonadota bacterium]